MCALRVSSRWGKGAGGSFPPKKEGRRERERERDRWGGGGGGGGRGRERERDVAQGK